MTGHSVIHDTFTVERTYDMAPARVFAAFSTAEARNSWGDTGDLEQPKDEGASDITEFDFRAGGRECFTTEWEGATYRYDGRYNGAGAPEMRRGGTIELIEGLTGYLQRQGTP